jgi:hypothetical protein
MFLWTGSGCQRSVNVISQSIQQVINLAKLYRLSPTSETLQKTYFIIWVTQHKRVTHPNSPVSNSQRKRRGPCIDNQPLSLTSTFVQMALTTATATRAHNHHGGED